MSKIKTRNHVSAFLASVDYEGGLLDFALLLNEQSIGKSNLCKIIESVDNWIENERKLVKSSLITEKNSSRCFDRTIEAIITTILFLKLKEISKKNNLNHLKSIQTLEEEGLDLLEDLKNQVEDDFLYELYMATRERLKNNSRFAINFEKTKQDIELLNLRLRNSIIHSSNSKSEGETGALFPIAKKDEGPNNYGLALALAVILVSWIIQKARKDDND